MDGPAPTTRPGAGPAGALVFERSYSSIPLRRWSRRAAALLVLDDFLLTRHVRQIAALTVKNRLPAIAGIAEFAEAGGLVVYGPNFPDVSRRAATYVDKILKGAKPGDLPIEQPTKFDLVVNLKTAKTLGLTIPQSLLLRADELIR